MYNVKYRGPSKSDSTFVEAQPKGAFFVTYHLYAYTCKLKWDCGTNFSTSHPTVPLEFTCISIQVGLWYVTKNAALM